MEMPANFLLLYEVVKTERKNCLLHILKCFASSHLSQSTLHQGRGSKFRSMNVLFSRSNTRDGGEHIEGGKKGRLKDKHLLIFLVTWQPDEFDFRGIISDRQFYHFVLWTKWGSVDCPAPGVLMRRFKKTNPPHQKRKRDFFERMGSYFNTTDWYPYKKNKFGQRHIQKEDYMKKTAVCKSRTQA
ncbi:uncharacterized protein LOC124983001 isoform X2 [Sciurus carolinensis]|uniref:uncharacterized protein LOC124983001 isoform X2 n=1 Tax=Sciurus carolinensis TaxID=30640 RepID=UPI001FB397C9|nr:uncharacterized protein LOC124983001 isoform X2 [Sciurus carolinensis]